MNSSNNDSAINHVEGQKTILDSPPTEVLNDSTEQPKTNIETNDKAITEKKAGGFRQFFFSGSSIVKETLSSLSGFTSSSTEDPSKSHALPQDRNSSRRYRRDKPEHITCTDSDDDDDAIVFSCSPQTEIVTLAQLGGVNFEGKELTDNRILNPGCISLTSTHICFLRDLKNKEGQYTLTARYPLNTITRIACKRQVPELLTFTIGFEDGGKTTTTAIHRYIMSQAGECAKAVKDGIIALLMKSDPLAC